MPFYSIDADSNLAVHPDKDAAIKEAGAAGAAFATEAELSEAAALWPASRMVDVVLDLVDDWHAGCWCWDDVSRASSYAALAIGFVAVSISLWGKIARPPGRAH